MPESLDDKLKEIEALQACAAKKSADVNSGIASIQAGIRNKTYTSGDVIKDFMIVCYGLNPDKEIEKQLRVLQKTIDKNQKKQVLVVSREQSHRESHGCFGGGFSHISGGNDLLGIIDGKLSFNFENYELIIPVVEKYVKRESHGKWKAQNGNIQISVLDLKNLDEWAIHGFSSQVFDWTNNHYGGHNTTSHQFRILVDKEVEPFFKINEDQYVWGTYGPAILDKIRKDPSKDISNEWFEIFGRIDTSYVAALELLETEASKEFKKKYAEEIVKKKDDVQKRILESIDYALKNKQSDFEASKFGVIKTLKEAVELGMHKEERIIQYSNIPGLSLNVQKYIVDMCQKQEIKTE